MLGDAVELNSPNFAYRTIPNFKYLAWKLLPCLCTVYKGFQMLIDLR